MGELRVPMLSPMPWLRAWSTWVNAVKLRWQLLQEVLLSRERMGS